MIQMSRLPGRSVKGFGWSSQRHQLWLSPEYLLYREISGYREVVKRYYYGDIQAIISGPTKSWRNCIVFTSTMLVVFLGLFALSAPADVSYPAMVLIIAGVGLSLIILIMNFILGPTCKTVLYTATSEAPLYSLGRKRSAEKAIALMLPFIEAAQRGEAPAAAEPVPPGAPEVAADPSAWTPPTEG